MGTRCRHVGARTMCHVRAALRLHRPMWDTSPSIASSGAWRWWSYQGIPHCSGLFRCVVPVAIPRGITGFRMSMGRTSPHFGRRILQGMPLACAMVPVAHVGFVACDPADQAIGSHGSLSPVVSMWAFPDLKHGGHWDPGVESILAKVAAACVRRCCLYRKWCVGLSMCTMHGTV